LKTKYNEFGTLPGAHLTRRCAEGRTATLDTVHHACSLQAHIDCYEGEVSRPHCACFPCCPGQHGVARLAAWIHAFEGTLQQLACSSKRPDSINFIMPLMIDMKVWMRLFTELLAWVGTCLHPIRPSTRPYRVA